MTGDTVDRGDASISDVVAVTRYGVEMLFAVPDRAEYIQSHHVRGALYEEDLLGALYPLLRPDELVLDVGANIGNHTVFFAVACRCRVVAIEPEAANFAHLQRNIELNGRSAKVTPIRAAAAAVAGQHVETVAQDEGNSGSVSVNLIDRETGVESLRLDDLELPAPPRLLKIDTEGMELEVLKGATDLLSRHGPILVVEAKDAAEFDAIAEFLKPFSYVCVDARNPTPTFIFERIAVDSGLPELVDRLATTFAHQRISLSREINRLNLTVREARRTYERSRNQLAELQTRTQVLSNETAALRDRAARYEAQLSQYQLRERELQDSVRKLGANLTRVSADRDRAARSYRTTAQALSRMRSSESFRLGHLIIKAFTQPGVNTLLLPWRILKVIVSGKRAAAQDDTPSLKAAAPVVQRPAPAVLPAPQKRTDVVAPAPAPRRRREFEDLSQLHVACILDEFSFMSFAPECGLLQLTPENWREELNGFDPDLLFVESAWRGKDELWDRKISYASAELVEVVAWCRERGVPTAFWNKEDPVHFRTFIGTAKLFDHIFTTDIDCVSGYKTVLGTENVHPLLFACQPQLHNPLELYDRQDAFCFAGAYYARYPDRIADLETFVGAITRVGRLDIYDRNLHYDHPDYTFPDSYRSLIVGHLPPEQIDRAYKGYRYSVNLNSIKQSQTMFARRVYELLASNAVTVSNFSRGLRLMLGDLVISTDDGTRLLDQVQQFTGDEVRYRKFRLAGLRKALSEHTYRDRLAYVAEKALGITRTDPLPDVTVAALVGDNAALEQVLSAYHGQRRAGKELLIVLADSYEPTELTTSPDVRTITWAEASSRPLREFAGEGFVAGLVPGDYYGPNYLLDLALATRYSTASAIGKAMWYHHASGECRTEGDGGEYRTVGSLPLRCSIVRVGRAGDQSLAEWVQALPDDQISGDDCLSVDEFNYCRDHATDRCEAADDLDLPNTGLPLAEIEAAADAIPPDEEAFNARQMTGAQILDLLKAGEGDGVRLRADGDRLSISANLEGHEYLYAKALFAVGDLGFQGEAKLYLDATTGLDVRCTLIFLDGRRRKLGTTIAIANRNHRAEIPPGTEWVQLALRIGGTGNCYVERLVFDTISVTTGATLGHSDVLVVSNQYPEYDNLYRYAFLHRRVVEYRRSGRLVDVFRFNANAPGGYFEFDGVDVTSGYEDELRRALSSGRYRTVLVHFLDPPMWEVLKDFIERIRVIVWVHGSEVQPWHRREYNLANENERQQARRASDERLKFWRSILRDMHCNVHVVFVSQYFADEVMEDVGIRLPEGSYSVIHNFIDTGLFAYHPKEPEQRGKVLSIRPYASRKYANDLAAEAILELSKEPFFGEMEFRLIGDGRLFEEIVAPLRRFPNVTVERGFLRQEEIAALHREYGVFLVPTRMDAQGVSRDEAMASGLVPITNRVAAVPEFVDESCGILVDAEDSHGLAEGLTRLYHDPDLFLRLSRNAAARVKQQSGRDQTIARELDLFGSSPPQDMQPGAG